MRAPSRRSGSPLWIPQSLWLLGLLFFVVVIVLLLARSIIALARGEYSTVARLIGTRSVDEEVAEGDQGMTRRVCAPSAVNSDTGHP